MTSQERVKILLNGLTFPHVCACSKTNARFPASTVVFFVLSFAGELFGAGHFVFYLIPCPSDSHKKTVLVHNSTNINKMNNYLCTSNH